MRVLLLLFGLMLSSAVFAQADINWLTFEEANAKNKVEPRKTLVFFETSWCGFCKKMDRIIFQDEEMINYLNDNYYTIRFDAESRVPVTFDEINYGYDDEFGSRGTHEIAKDMLQGYTAYPGVVFLDEDYNGIRILHGLQPKQLFSTFLKYINDDAYKSQDWFEYSGQD